jgi:hypothetical protein
LIGIDSAAQSAMSETCTETISQDEAAAQVVPLSRGAAIAISPARSEAECREMQEKRR